MHILLFPITFFLAEKFKNERGRGGFSFFVVKEDRRIKKGDERGRRLSSFLCVLNNARYCVGLLSLALCEPGKFTHNFSAECLFFHFCFFIFVSIC